MDHATYRYGPRVRGTGLGAPGTAARDGRGTRESAILRESGPDVRGALDAGLAPGIADTLTALVAHIALDADHRDRIVPPPARKRPAAERGPEATIGA
jgi:hypothetical protein